MTYHQYPETEAREELFDAKLDHYKAQASAHAIAAFDRADPGAEIVMLTSALRPEVIRAGTMFNEWMGFDCDARHDMLFTFVARAAKCADASIRIQAMAILAECANDFGESKAHLQMRREMNVLSHTAARRAA